MGGDTLSIVTPSGPSKKILCCPFLVHQSPMPGGALGSNPHDRPHLKAGMYLSSGGASDFAMRQNIDSTSVTSVRSLYRSHLRQNIFFRQSRKILRCSFTQWRADFKLVHLDTAYVTYWATNFNHSELVPNSVPRVYSIQCRLPLEELTGASTLGIVKIPEGLRRHVNNRG